jgi:hypothetical protein
MFFLSQNIQNTQNFVYLVRLHNRVAAWKQPVGVLPTITKCFDSFDGFVIKPSSV